MIMVIEYFIYDLIDEKINYCLYFDFCDIVI